jgi:uroporphyrinogen-III synthase
LTRADGRASLILITRPQEPGRLLAARLRDAGCDALWWPAFDLLPPQDAAALRSCVSRLAQFDLVVFVSPAAVQAFAAAMTDAWPGYSAIAAVGAATRSAALAGLPGAERARIIAPEGLAAADGGSESLWRSLQALEPAPRRVLIVRAQGGRQWLLERLLVSGAQVEQAVAYRRVAHVPDPVQWAALRAGKAAGARLALLYSSTEAVPVLAAQLRRDEELSAWLAGAVALCVHQRIEQALRTSGHADIRRCDPDVQSIRDALRSDPGAMRPATANDQADPASNSFLRIS